MPSKLNDSFDKKDYNPDTLAGAYAHRRIEDFVNTIYEASYPHAPEQTGGKVYNLCKNHLDECMQIIGDNNPSNLSFEQKVQIRAKAIDSLNNLVESLSADNTLNRAEQHYLDEFTFIKEITDKILAGEDADSIRTFIRTAPIGDNEPPRPPEPQQ